MVIARDYLHIIVVFVTLKYTGVVEFAVGHSWTTGTSNTEAACACTVGGGRARNRFVPTNVVRYSS
jgi:hypothetical protein